MSGRLACSWDLGADQRRGRGREAPAKAGKSGDVLGAGRRLGLTLGGDGGTLMV